MVINLFAEADDGACGHELGVLGANLAGTTAVLLLSGAFVTGRSLGFPWAADMNWNGNIRSAICNTCLT